VRGLLIQIIIIARGRFAPSQKHIAIANKVWIGSGINAQKIPINTARDTEWRLRCKRFGSCDKEPSHLSDR
jgi:hypothetical protein